MIVVFPEDKTAINIDRIDGFIYSEEENKTYIYVGGGMMPFKVKKTLHEVEDIINEADMRR